MNSAQALVLIYIILSALLCWAVVKMGDDDE